MKCDIIIPVWNQLEYTVPCVESITKNTRYPYRLIFVDNASDAPTQKYLENLRDAMPEKVVLLKNKENLGFLRAINRGLEVSDSPFVCLENNDTIVTEGWLEKMIGILESDRRFGMINPTWEGRPEGVSPEGYSGILERSSVAKTFIETDWCRGFSVVIKRAVIDKIGPMDSAFGFAYFEDVDYSVRAIEAGFLCLKALNTYVYHVRNVTACKTLRGDRWTRLHERNKNIYYKKWGRPLRIVIIITKDKTFDKEGLDRIEEAVFYLARKQHRIIIWSRQKLDGRFLHTNVKLKSCGPVFTGIAALSDLYFNRKKKTEKRYDAVFIYDKAYGNTLQRIRCFKGLNIYTGENERVFGDVIKETTGAMKNDTKAEAESRLAEFEK